MWKMDKNESVTFQNALQKKSANSNLQKKIWAIWSDKRQSPFSNTKQSSASFLLGLWLTSCAFERHVPIRVRLTRYCGRTIGGFELGTTEMFFHSVSACFFMSTLTLSHSLSFFLSIRFCFVRKWTWNRRPPPSIGFAPPTSPPPPLLICSTPFRMSFLNQHFVNLRTWFSRRSFDVRRSRFSSNISD